MTDKVFVDTKILVYASDAAYPEKQQVAFDALAGLWQSRKGRISVQVCNEFFLYVTRRLKPGMTEAAAWRRVEMYAAWDPLPIDYKLLVKAREAQTRYSLPWWDSLIIASAFMCECSTILSEDLASDHDYFGIQVVDPFAHL